ncbi:hypothetical protein [Mycoplasmopsis bovirhinis]|uniref:hypothetical protein n=1 Tax=Mycoplasmopsis bovirhinis TaxID=29553 RepID=UPI000E7555DF|nr:hypothetical protein [Mycoplasmopsis bovirhinis]
MSLEAIKGHDKQLNFYFKYKNESLDETVLTAFDHHTTTHIVAIDKMHSWDGYQIKVFTPGLNDYS